MDSDWQIKLASVKKRNEYVLKSGLRTDCSFMVGVDSGDRRLFQAHKFMLSNASPVFERMFYGSLPEKENKVIEIYDIEPDDFKSLLHFIYTDELLVISNDRAQQLYFAANKYMLDQLKRSCIRYLRGNIVHDNVCQIYEFAKQIEEQSLEDTCLEVIRTDTYSILLTSSLLLANITTLDSIVSQDTLNINSELDLFDALEKYATFRLSIDKRRDSVCTICECAILTTELKVNKTETVPVPVEGENNVSGDSDETTAATGFPSNECESSSKENEHKKRSGHQLIEDVAYFSTIIKKIRFLTLTSKEFAGGPALSRLLSRSEAFALLICIDEPENCTNHFPHGFSDSREKRFDSE